MNGWGKIVGGLLGFILAGPGGLLLGGLCGHIFDRNITQRLRQGRYWHANTTNITQKIFFKRTFQVMGHIAKLDGRVSEAEIHTARLVMKRLGLNEHLRREAMHLFNQGKQPNFSLQSALRDLATASHHDRALLQLFIEIQFQTALAEGFLTPTKQRVLAAICQSLGFSTWQFNWFEQLFSQVYQQSTGQQQRQDQQYHHQQQSATSTTQATLQNAYLLLEMSPQASNADIKRAYRRLMSRHHPDKLLAKGLPDSMIKLATEKTQTIQAAYDRICAARGL